MQGLTLICAGLLAAVVASVTNWLALIPWRRARGRHWSEQARLYHPVRVAAASNFWVLPAVLTLLSVLVWRDQAPHWTLVALATAIGTVVGTIPMDREVFPRIGLGEWMTQVAVGWVIRFFIWFVFLAAIAFMPDEFNAKTLVVLATVLALCILWECEGGILLGRRLGVVRPPTDRLRTIVQETASRMGIAFDELWLVRSPLV